LLLCFFMLRTCHSRGRRRLSSKGDAPLRIESHVSRTAHTKTTHAHTSCARLPSWRNERGWQIARPQTGKRDRTLPRTRAAPKFGLFIHLGTGTRCPHSACLARHTPVLTQRHATAGTSIRENSCRAHPRTTSCCHHLRHCGSHAFARTILFQRQRLRLWSYCQLLTSPPRCAHAHAHIMCRFPTLRTRSG